MKTVKTGIIGGGLMGREMASAFARWCALLDMPVRPESVPFGSGKRPKNTHAAAEKAFKRRDKDASGGLSLAEYAPPPKKK
jgi:3-hydroxyacyl-CoA dehydrogenase